MGIVFRQSVKTSIVTFAGALLGAATLYLGARFIPKQELGFIRNTLPEQAALVAQVLSFGLNITLIVFVHKYVAGDRRRTALISMSLLLPLLLFLALLPFYFFFKQNIIGSFQPADIPLVTRFYGWLPVLTLFFLYMLLLEQYLVSQMKVAASTFMREVLLRVLIIALIILFGLNVISYDRLVPATVLVFIIPVALLVGMSFRTEGFKLSFKWNVFEGKEKKEIASFTWYHFLLTISINMMSKIDIILLAFWSSLSATAIYGIAVYILSFLQIPYRAMLNASFPILTKAYHDNDFEKVKDVFVRSSLNILVASTGLAAIIACNLHNAVAILPKGYEPISMLVLILMAGRLFDLSTGMNDQILSISNYYRFTFLVSIVVVGLLIVFNYFLITRYSYYGAALATTLALIVYNFAKLTFIKVKLQLQPFSIRSLWVVLAGIVATIIGFVIPFIVHPVVDAIIRSGIICFTYVAILLILKPSPDLNSYLASVKKNKRLF
jgi:O-antigen/teichoic acid export membrane protein